jgi:hypothetical protein
VLWKLSSYCSTSGTCSVIQGMNVGVLDIKYCSSCSTSGTCSVTGGWTYVLWKLSTVVPAPLVVPVLLEGDECRCSGN